MEGALEVTPDLLKNHAFWQSGCAFALPPGSDDSSPLARATSALDSMGWSAVVFPTSGSTGVPKWVVIKKPALLASARMVCAHLGVTAGEAWVCPLPLGHVGAVGVFARAMVSGCVPVWSGERWNVDRFLEVCRDHSAVWCSLVPTQVHDLVVAGTMAPESLRGVVVGGGALAGDLFVAASALGWPLLPSFGMTETASQIATARPGDPRLTVIDGWDVRTDAADGVSYGTLMVRGEGVYAGYLTLDDSGQPELSNGPDPDGWVKTSDLVTISTTDNGERVLAPDGRADNQVKVLGELVSLDAVEQRLHRYLAELEIDPMAVAVVALPDSRSGSRLVAAVDQAMIRGDVDGVVASFNRLPATLGPERIGLVVGVESIPRSALGKVRRAELVALVGGRR